MRRRCVILVVGLALASLAGSGGGASTKDAKASLYNELLESAKTSLAAGSWDAFKKDVEGRIAESLSKSGEKVPIETLRDLFYFRNVGVTFSKVTGETHKAMMGWLLEHRDFCGRFLHALDEQDDLPAALGILKQLRDEDEALFVQNSEFCIAYAIVWDNFQPMRYWKEPKVQPNTMMETYRYFNRNAKLLRIPPSTLPWELSVYVVDLAIPDEERMYALTTYRSQADIGKLFFKVPYTFALSPAHGHGVDTPYTLMNIIRMGGVCMEQAYFAASVGKCLGVPSVYSFGMGKRGGHAWVSFVRTDRRPVMWDLLSGRYSYDHYYKGLTADPTNWGMQNSIPLSILQMSAAILTAGSPAKLEDARYCRDAAEWLARNTLAEGDSAKIAYELLLRSLGTCAYSRESWMTLAELAEGGKLSEEQTARSVDLLFKYTLRDFPDFTEMCLERFLNSVKDPVRKAAILGRAFTAFKERPDLASEIKVAEGDLLLSQGKVKEAVVAYCWPLAEFPEEGHATGAVEERIEKLSEHVADKAELAKIYRSLLDSILRNAGNKSEGLTTIFQTLSVKLIALYRELGQEKDAALIEKVAGAYLASRPKR